MITKIIGEQPFQVLTNNFSISPSNEGYTLQISADGKQYSNLFRVGAGVTRLVTGVAANSYYRLSGNQSQVSVNWMKTCVTEGGGSGTELQPVADFPLNAVEGTVISYTGSSSASGVYQYDGNEWTGVGANIDLSAYWTSAETQSAITAVEDHLFDVEQVTASALTELHDGLLEVSARTVDMSGYWTSAETQDAINEVVSAYTPTANFATINGSAITNGGDITVADPDMSDYWNSAETKTYTDNRIDGFESAVTLTQVDTNQHLGLNGSTVCEAGDISWQALARPRFFTTNIQQYEIGNAPYDPGLGTVNYLKFKYVGETDDNGFFTGVYYALPDNGEFVEGVPVQLTRTTVEPTTVYTTPAGAESGYFIWDNVNLTITWKIQPVVPLHIDGVYDAIDILDADIQELSARTTDLSDYWTSAQTEEAISAATSGKADAANITGRNTGYYFPYYNEQGVITGDTQAYKANLTIHLSDGSTASANLFKDNNYGIPGIYVASTPGTAGQIAKSDGYGFTWANDDKVSSTYVSTIWKGTQAEYDAIATKDPNTFYIIL